MIRSAMEEKVCTALAGGPLTLAELTYLLDCHRSPIDSALRLLRAEGLVTVTALRAQNSGAGRSAWVYQLAGTPA